MRTDNTLDMDGVSLDECHVCGADAPSGALLCRRCYEIGQRIANVHQRHQNETASEAEMETSRMVSAVTV